MKRYKLVSEIIRLSSCCTWFFAKLEWKIASLYHSDDPERCLCGHFPINYICEIMSSENGTITIVGNCCVKRFISSDPDKVFQAYKRVSADATRSLNKEAINFAYKQGWIECFEWFFYFSIMNEARKSLTVHELEKKKKINLKVIRKMSRYG